jgi:DNA-directed RNA polymerase subunit RPC12/RpoP
MKCSSCRKEFTNDDGDRIYKTCPHCRLIGYKSNHKTRWKERLDKRPKATGLDAHLAELAEYNKQNGTHLSYGRFMALKEGGVI